MRVVALSALFGLLLVADAGKKARDICGKKKNPKKCKKVAKKGCAWNGEACVKGEITCDTFTNGGKRKCNKQDGCTFEGGVCTEGVTNPCDGLKRGKCRKKDDMCMWKNNECSELVVCLAIVEECSDGTFVSPDADNGCLMPPCPVTCWECLAEDQVWGQDGECHESCDDLMDMSCYSNDNGGCWTYEDDMAVAEECGASAGCQSCLNKEVWLRSRGFGSSGVKRCIWFRSGDSDPGSCGDQHAVWDDLPDDVATIDVETCETRPCDKGLKSCERGGGVGRNGKNGCAYDKCPIEYYNCDDCTGANYAWFANNECHDSCDRIQDLGCWDSQEGCEEARQDLAWEYKCGSIEGCKTCANAKGCTFFVDEEVEGGGTCHSNRGFGDRVGIPENVVTDAEQCPSLMCTREMVECRDGSSAGRDGQDGCKPSCPRMESECEPSKPCRNCLGGGCNWDENGTGYCQCAVPGRPYVGGGQSALVAPTTEDSDWVSGALSGDHPDAAEAWTVQGQLEHASVASFSRFALNLMVSGAPPSLLKRAHTAAAQEISHAQLSFGLASRYQGSPVSAGAFPENSFQVTGDLKELTSAVLAEGVINEGTAAFVAQIKAAAGSKGPAADALHQIAVEEASHATLAYDTVRWTVTQDPSLTSLIDDAIANTPEQSPGMPANLGPLAELGVISEEAHNQAAMHARVTSVAPTLRELLVDNTVAPTNSTSTATYVPVHVFAQSA